jgi:FkbM family methyltransferase
MLPFLKNAVRKAIRVTGFDVTKLDARNLGGHSLLHELPLLVENQQSPNIVDVGANRGQRIGLAKHAFRKPQITSFEPNPTLAKALRSKYGAGQATIVEAAVGNAEAQMDFHIYSNDRLGSLRDLEPGMAHLSHGRVDPEATIKVPVVTLDSYWREHHGDEAIDVLFIDAQGFDREVLEGAEGLLDSGKIGTIIMDVYFGQYYKDQTNNLSDVQPWLGEKGYGLVGLYEIIRQDGFVSAAAGCFQLNSAKRGTEKDRTVKSFRVSHNSSSELAQAAFTGAP